MENSSDGIWDVVRQVLDEHGMLALLLLLICFAFWRLIWKVWNAAMKSKDEEIERLVKERDRYQALVFERLMSSRTNDDEEKQKKDEP